MMNIQIKKMLPCHWNDVSKIYKMGIDSLNATFQTEVPSYEDWDKSHLNNCRYVAVVDNEIAGWVALSPVSSRCVYGGVTEVSIYIHNNYKGKKIGEALMKYIINQSEQDGIWTLFSSVFEENIPSISLHKKCGFREIGYREKIAKDSNGKWRNCIIFEKRSKSVGID